jgi:hypothetical protein
MQGETVNLAFTSSDATSISDIGIYDTNGGVRTLASNELLLIDSLQGSANLGTNRADLFFDDDAGSDVDQGEIVASLTAGNMNVRFGHEGRGGKVGKGLKIKASAAGQIVIGGTARIIKGKTEGQRPSWRESLVPGQ